MKTLIQKNWLLILILLISGFARLYKIGDYMEFLGDQGRDAVIARDFLKNGNLFFIGPQTSIGNMYLGPFYYYLFVVPGLILTNFNPIGPSIIVAIFGIATVYLIYWFASRYLNKSTAYFASSLYAISPVIIKYSNFSWNPNIMPFFALVFVISIIKSTIDSKPKYLLLATLSFIVCLNSHFLALLLLPFAAIYLLLKLFFVFQNKQSFKQYLFYIGLSLTLFVLSLTPQILFDLKHQGQNINAIVHFFTYRETTVNLKPYKSIYTIFPLFTQVNTRLIFSKADSFGFIGSILILFLGLTAFIKKKSPTYLLLWIWYGIGLIGLSLYKQHIYDHYFGFIFPVIFLIVGYILSRLPKIISLPIFFGLISLGISQNPFRWQPPRQLQTTSDITKLIIRESSGQPFNFSLLAKQNYDPPYRYFFAEKNASLYNLDQKITDQLFVVCEPFQIDCNPINNPEWSIAAFGWAKIDSQWQVNGINIYKLTHTQQ
ncbi:glycosyltransferase family 39 protein [Candidatus Shapirobacteria bacterium]|nr:glycosyltransferase family 39 protein [Candidatus Shapirobacteria bacterium]